MNIENHFKKESIINNLAKYEMFYQIALGSLISITDSKPIDHEVEFQYALGSIYELIKDIESFEEEIDFEEELRKQSAMDALQNFVNENLELVKKGDLDVENFVNHINDGIFFNEAMQEICDQNIHTQVLKWEAIITDELAESIMHSLKELEAQKN